MPEKNSNRRRNQPRQPPGQSIGGEFAEDRKAESEVELGAPFSAPPHDPWDVPDPKIRDTVPRPPSFGPVDLNPGPVPSAAPAPAAGPTGRPDDPVSSNDPRIAAGEIFDTIEVKAGPYDGTVFHRLREGAYPEAPYAIRIQANRPISDDELDDLGGRVGYAYAMAGRGEGTSDPTRDSPSSFIISADTTKGRVYRNLYRFEEALPKLLSEGSSVRQTDRAGEGTAGTRLIGPLKYPIVPEIYYDNATVTEM